MDDYQASKMIMKHQHDQFFVFLLSFLCFFFCDFIFQQSLVMIKSCHNSFVDQKNLKFKIVSSS